MIKFNQEILSAVAQWKRAGLITLMSSDRNRAALMLNFFSVSDVFMKHLLLKYQLA